MTRAVLAWMRRLAGVFGAGNRDREFRAELESHVQMHIDDNLRSGMSPEEARRHALIKLGGLDQTRALHRDRRRLPAVETALQDLRFALRLMRRSPGFTAIVLSTLSLGIGANAAMFSIVNTVLLRPLPYDDSSQLVSVQTVRAADRSPFATSPPDFYAYRERNQTLTHLDAFYAGSFNLTGTEPERIPGLVVSSGFFTDLGVQPSLGRSFVIEDEQWGAHRVAVLSDGLWRRRFAADGGIVGRSVALNGQPYVVIGVLPRAFSFLGLDAQLVVPMAFEPGDNMNSHSNYFLRMIGRLRPTVTREQASADLNRISEAIIAEQSVNEGTAIHAAPLREALVGDVRRPVLVLLGAVGFVLLISCANLANLLLARALVRQKEIAVRLAIGATRGRLLRQFLIESLLLSLTGGALGVLLAYASMDALNLLSMRVLPRVEDVRVDPLVLAFTFGVAVVTGILLGLAPALHGVAADVVEGLKDSARGASGSTGGHRLRSALVTAEVALSLVLLAGAGLMVKNLYQLLRLDTGFQPDGVLTMQIDLPPQKYVDRQLERRFDPEAYVKAVAFFTEVIERVREVPGAQAVGAINGLPLMGEVWGKHVTLFDRPLPNDIRDLPSIQYRVVAGDYFQALGVRVRSGRAFSDRDTMDAPKVAIVNREMARRHYRDADPVGKIISVNPPLELLPKSLIEEARRAGTLPDDYEPARLTVVGVVDDVLYGGLNRSALPLVYAPYSQGAEGTTNMFLVVRSAVDPLALTGAIRHQVAEIDPDQPVANIQTMNVRVAASVAQPRLQMNVLGTFAAVSALVAAIGIYGVMSFAVKQRQREIGIRLALGATRQEVVALILRQGLRMVALGVALGVIAALMLTRVLRTLLFGVSTTDPSVFTLIVVVLSLTAWLATYLPARRAARLEPLATLRDE